MRNEVTRPTFGALSFALGFATRVFGENVTDPKAMQSLAWIQDNLRPMLDAYDVSISPEGSAAEPFDLVAWNQDRLDACRITGTTAERQEYAISPAALAYAQSLAEQPETTR